MRYSFLITLILFAKLAYPQPWTGTSVSDLTTRTGSVLIGGTNYTLNIGPTDHAIQLQGTNCVFQMINPSGTAGFTMAFSPAFSMGMISPSLPIDFFVNSHHPLFLQTNGNVLINKTTQTNTSYVLDVNGNVRADKLVVNTTGADFVFDSAYRLQSLESVEKYIRQNHHLPGMASAAQMKDDGLDIGDNQTRQLQKIEELTLYIIEQQKQIKTLQTQLEELKSQLHPQSKRHS